ncbi:MULTISPECIES: Imm40 family immunity protein [unclassified Luteibacter]|uniref:Imm40 family immunity protein n=1 Tax=unclassified Luteibacter TaxID=2620188 RepID=UPI00163ADD5E|nr:Imm40 family immunity protein [Luteibacter sp. 9135]
MMESLGVADVALLADDAVDAAETLEGTGVAILGGDVFYATAQGFEMPRAYWDTKPNPGETAAEYVIRSILETRDYIRGYQVPANKTALFSMVVAQVF